MTRIAALADLHGNLPALDAILADLAHHAVDAVVVAGDLINLGPFSTEVLERVFGLGCAAIRGNHEFYLLDYGTPRAPAHWAHYTTPRWLNETIPPALKRRVAQMPDTLALTYSDAPPLRICHGFPQTHWDGMYPSTSDEALIAQFSRVEESTIIVGHVHLQQERWLQAGERRWQVINPGSAGLTLDGRVATAPYALLEGDADGWRVRFKRVPYDAQPLHAALNAPAYRAAHGAFARLYALEFARARIHTWPFNLWRADHCPDAAVTDLLVDQYLAMPEDERQPWIAQDF